MHAKKLGLLTAILISNIYAGTIKIKGISNIGRAPDFLELKVDVHSKCFASANEASARATELAKEMAQVIKENIDLASGDQLITRPGLSQRKREEITRYNPRTGRHENEVLCEQGWQHNRVIIARFTDINAFNDINPALLSIIDNVQSLGTSEEGVLGGKVHAPTPKLMPETKSAMEGQALKEALINASNKFKTVRDLCSLENASLLTMSEAPAVIRDYRDGGTVSDTLNFEFQYVHLAWDIEWEFDNTGGVCESISLN